MSCPIELIDGLESCADALRAAAGAAAYHRLTVKDDDGQAVAADLISPAPLGPSEVIVGAAGERGGARFRLINASFRVDELPGDGAELHIAGGLPGDEDISVLVMGLGQQLPGDAGPLPPFNGYEPSAWPGLAFWRHAPSGQVLGRRPVSTAERFISSSWSMQGLARLVPGRLVLAPALAYVSLWPGTVPPNKEELRPSSVIWAAYVEPA